MKKVIIFDAGCLISLSMNGLFEEIKKLKSIFNGSFIITNQVKMEIVDKPIQRKRFELEALRLKKLIDEGILEMPESIGINSSDIDSETDKVMKQSNELFTAEGNFVHIIDLGEASCVALSKILTDKKVKNVIAVDERTLRMLGEKPDNLINLLKRKLHTHVTLNKKNVPYFKKLRFIRSAEILYVGYKKGIFDFGDGILLDALLYAVKFKGCAISDEEIKEIKKLK